MSIFYIFTTTVNTQTKDRFSLILHGNNEYLKLCQIKSKPTVESKSSMTAEAPNPVKSDFLALFFFFLYGGGSGVHCRSKMKDQKVSQKLMNI